MPLLRAFLFGCIFLLLVCAPYHSEALGRKRGSSPFSFASPHFGQNTSNVPAWMRASSSSIVENEYIVTFNKYMHHTEHRTLIAALVGSKGWDIVQRKNPSWELPSDFSLIKILNHDEEGILSKLRKSRDVRYVTPQRRFVGQLQSLEEEEENENENHLDGIFAEANSTNHYGRFHTKFSIEDVVTQFDGVGPSNLRRLHASTVSTNQVTDLFNAQYLWDKQYTGTGVRVAVFDTGLRTGHPHFKNVPFIRDWTDEGSSVDALGHGTFVAGVIASQSECLGFAPDSELFIFRVFTNHRVSYTSWFLDAFNYAIHAKINVLNLSIGGPDFLDKPFVEKVSELSANNVIVVSAIGNDGPLYGTLNNPADQPDVIGVGGVDYNDRLASFSSRGMTTWELPEGYGRVKPDILAYGQSVQGSRIYGGCRALSGTSVASPVVAGAVALLASTVPEEKRWDVINVASIRQVLIGAAERLPDANIFEQGFGKLDLLGSYELLQRYQPHASAAPSTIDLTQCPYFWPYCSQPMYYSSQPVIFNVTILNALGVTGELLEPPVWKPARNGHLLEVGFSWPEVIWPWTGYLGVHARVAPEAAEWEGVVEGVIVFTVVSPPGLGETEMRNSTVEIPLRAQVIPTPPRAKRILFDQYHNLRYPSGYFPRDSLEMKDEPFDWNGDHLHTNFRSLFNHLRREGYYVEILGSPYTCFDAKLYGTLLLVDPEEEFFPLERKKLLRDVAEEGLSVIVFADWYNVDVMKKIKFFDENTRQWWTPATGGANVPALNDLLSRFGIAFGDRIYAGELEHEKERTIAFSSGQSIARFPKGGSLAFYDRLTDQTDEVLNNGNSNNNAKGSPSPVTSTGSAQQHQVDRVALFGLYPTTTTTPTSAASPISFDAEEPVDLSSLPTAGRIAVFGDSSCLDDVSKKPSCLWLLSNLLKWTAASSAASSASSPSSVTSSQNNVASDAVSWIEKLGPRVELDHVLDKEYVDQRVKLPVRLEGNDLYKYSKVIGHSANCKALSYKKYNQTEGEQVEIYWEEPHVVSRGGVNGKFRENSLSRNQRGSSSLFSSNSGHMAFLRGIGMFVPYMIGIVVVLFLVVLAFRSRQERGFSKRINV